MKTFRPSSLAVVVFVFACVGCSVGLRPGTEDVGGTVWGSGPTQAVGVAAYASGVGSLHLSLPGSYAGEASPPSTPGTSGAVSGSLVFAAETVPLSGTFDPTSGALSVSGGGYSVSGNADPSGVSGVAESGAGPGSFALMPGSATTLCGSFTGSLRGSVAFVYAPGGRAVAVYALTNADETGTTEGTVSGNQVSFIDPIVINGQSVTISGTLTGPTAQGTWSDGASTGGSWSAAACP